MMPKSITSQPAAAMSAIRVKRLLSKIWPGASVSPGACTSSPVLNSATLSGVRTDRLA